MQMLNHHRHLPHADRSRSSLLIMWIGGRVVTQVTALVSPPAWSDIVYSRGAACPPTHTCSTALLYTSPLSTYHCNHNRPHYLSFLTHLSLGNSWTRECHLLVTNFSLVTLSDLRSGRVTENLPLGAIFCDSGSGQDSCSGSVDRNGRLADEKICHWQ